MLSTEQKRIVTLRRHISIYCSNLESMTDEAAQSIVLGRLEADLAEWRKLREQLANQQPVEIVGQS